MKILKGAEVSAKIKEQVTQMMEGLEGPAPKLAIVRVVSQFPIRRQITQQVFL